MSDGIAVTTGCGWGRRTMRLMDYGKSAATFVNIETGRAIRLAPTKDSRTLAARCTPDAPDRWHAQLNPYQIMPTEELLQAQEVTLNLSLAPISKQHRRHGARENCGEDILNERHSQCAGKILCRACAEAAYYAPRQLAETISPRAPA